MRVGVGGGGGVVGGGGRRQEDGRINKHNNMFTQSGRFTSGQNKHHQLTFP